MPCQLHVVALVALTGLDGLRSAETRPAEGVIRSTETQRVAEYRFSRDDEALLDEIERACFLYFWKEVGSPARLAKDRLQAPVASSAAVGFQLSSLPIGVERKWITPAEGLTRARTALQALIERADNKKFGVYLHYPDHNTGGPSHEGFEHLASTVDHALLMAGAITAAQYFGGEVRALTDRMIADTNWTAFAVAPDGFLSMGWEPRDPNEVGGAGRFLDQKWDWASDEERLIYFLAAGAPDEKRAVPPELYYRLKRIMKQHGGFPPYVVSWNGTLFTYFFSHCWIDYGAQGADNPAQFGVGGPAVDWFENSRRAVLTHRQRCIEQAGRFKTFSADRWGLSACSARDGYIVPEVRPNASDHDDFCGGTIAPYAAGSAIMFAPGESLAALRAFRGLKGQDGQPLVWRDPNVGGYGFVDSFNLDQSFVCNDYVGIDQGPLLLAIENARTGLIWKLFREHELPQRAAARLRLGR